MGIPVRIHWTFLVMIYMVATLGSSQGDAGGTLWILGLTFGSVFLHELGHSLMAKRLGIRVLDITFWPLGGMARMSHMPEDSRVEGLVAVAGPLVNFLLAGIGLLVLMITNQSAGWAWSLLVINLLIGVFNLIPAFPMDGGRILRALLARNNDWVSATQGAVTVGRFFASLMFFGSLVYGFATGNMGLCMLPLIAGFIWISGAKELLAVRLRHGQNPFGPNVRFATAGFGGQATASDPAPAEWHSGDQRGAPGEQTVERPPRSARRPSDWSIEPPRHGFTEEDIKHLEDFHGRLDEPD